MASEIIQFENSSWININTSAVGITTAHFGNLIVKAPSTDGVSNELISGAYGTGLVPSVEPGFLVTQGPVEYLSVRQENGSLFTPTSIAVFEQMMSGDETDTLVYAYKNGLEVGHVSLGGPSADNSRVVIALTDPMFTDIDEIRVARPNATGGTMIFLDRLDISYALDTTAPTLSSTTPSDDASAIVKSADITLTFDEDVQAGTGNITLTNTADATDNRVIDITDGQVTFNGDTITINPTDDLKAGAHYSVTVDAGAIEDAAGNDFAGLTAATDLDFTIAAAAPPPSGSGSGGGGSPKPPVASPTTDGPDSVTGTSGSDTISGGLSADTIAGGLGNDSINGNQGADNINGNQGNDIVRGGQDDDIVQGGRDNDQVYGDNGQDWVNGNMGADTVNGGMGNDTVHGGQDNDEVRGGQGDDFVFGDLGDDQIWGDLGNDTLSGGAGSDMFRFAANSGNDVITDFSRIDGDVLDFQGQSYTVVDVDGSAVFTLSGGGVVVLTGVSSTSLDAGALA